MLKLIVPALILLLTAAPHAHPGTITVRPDGTGDYPTIQDAIDVAANGDEIVCSDGTYTGQGNRDIEFRGKAITVRSENGPENCIIDCGGGGPAFEFSRGEDANSMLDGFTITTSANYPLGMGILCYGASPTINNCRVTGMQTGMGLQDCNSKITNCIIMDNKGEGNGGIACYSASPTISNCIISGNVAESIPWFRVYGGGIGCAEGSSPTIKDCIISDNSASYGGGIGCVNGSNPVIINCTIIDNWGRGSGIYCENSSPAISNCTISENKAEDGWGVVCRESVTIIKNCEISGNAAGGVSCWRSNLTIANCTIQGNTSNGIACDDSTARIDNCIISGNAAGEGYRSGGGIHCGTSTMTVINSTIADNLAEWGGGIYAGGGSTTMIANCIISNNSAEGEYAYGGGISCYSGGSHTISNCVISGNNAKWSGGIDCIESNPIITNCTITGNIAEESGGGIGSTREASPVLANCIVWGNTARRGNQIAVGNEGRSWDSVLTLSFSDVEGGQDEVYSSPNSVLDWGEGNIDVDPGFAFDYDFHLVAGSACIDAGDPNYPAEPNETDFDGNPRIMGGRVDMGAYEFMPGSATIAVSTTTVSLVYFQDWVVPEVQTLLIRNCGEGTLNWRIAEECDWLRAEPMRGVSGGEIDKVTLVVEPNSLAVGLYRCELEVFAKNASNSPVTIEVSLRVGRTLRVPEDFATIREAVEAAEDFDMVLVADGIYTGEGNRGIDAWCKTIVIRSESGPENCIIDCEYGGHGFRFDCDYCEASEPVLDGFTIMRVSGHAVDNQGCELTVTNCVVLDSCGIWCSGSKAKIAGCKVSSSSGIYCGGSKVAISNCTISGNRGGAGSGIKGAGISCYDSMLTLEGCTIADNNGAYPWTQEGGGIYCENSELAIADCNITGNAAGEGGAIYCIESNLRVDMCTISDNRSRAEGNPPGPIRGGGGVYCEDASLTITDTTMADNTADGNFSGGGAILCRGSTELEIIDCTIRGNSAKIRGGGICCDEETAATITGCKIVGNSSEGGGGILCMPIWDKQTKINNCLITGNSAEDAGGIAYYGNERPDITNCTIANNIARSGYGGGIVIAGLCRPELDNCILWGNSAEDGEQIALVGLCPCSAGCRLTVNYSNVEGGPEAVYTPGHGPWWLNWDNGNIDADPCFVEPGYWDVNGVWVEGDYRLLPTSPCIDSGDPNYVAGPNETDLDGNPRILDGDEDGVALVDMGAYEFWPPVEAEMTLTPHALSCASKGRWVKAHVVLPEGYLPEDVDISTPAVALPMDIESEYMKVFASGKGPVSVEIRFDRTAFCAELTETGEIEVTVTGSLTSGQYFYAADTIKIKPNPRQITRKFQKTPKKPKRRREK